MSEEILRLVERFWSTASDASWAADRNNRLGMAYDLDHALDIHSGLFREQLQREEGDTLFYELVWRGEKGRVLHDLIRDFYLLFSEVAEESSFVRWSLGRDEVTFSFAAGYGGEPPHGHFVVIRLVGPAVKETLQGYRRIEAQNRRLHERRVPKRK